MDHGYYLLEITIWSSNMSDFFSRWCHCYNENQMMSRNVAAAIDGTVVMTTELMVWAPGAVRAGVGMMSWTLSFGGLLGVVESAMNWKISKNIQKYRELYLWIMICVIYAYIYILCIWRHTIALTCLFFEMFCLFKDHPKIHREDFNHSDFFGSPHSPCPEEDLGFLFDARVPRGRC